MSTRCTISIIDTFGREYRIYRHTDGEPEKVLHDLKLILENVENFSIDKYPGTFLANFIFYERYSYLLKYLKEQRAWMYKGWESIWLSEVCSSLCNHSDLVYRYTLYFNDKGELKIKIEKRNFKKKTFNVLFDGLIDDAFEKFSLKQSHILPEAFGNPRKF
jgi:hypothetical protein